jgi:hypothetical protein
LIDVLIWALLWATALMCGLTGYLIHDILGPWRRRVKARQVYTPPDDDRDDRDDDPFDDDGQDLDDGWGTLIDGDSLGLPEERSWAEITGAQPAVSQVYGTPDWKRQLLGGHANVDELVESMWTRAQAAEVRKLTGPQARRARHKARHKARKEMAW